MLHARRYLAAATLGLTCAAALTISGALDAPEAVSEPTVQAVAAPAAPVVTLNLAPDPQPQIRDVAARAGERAQATIRERAAAEKRAQAEQRAQQQAEQQGAEDGGYPAGGAEGLRQEREANAGKQAEWCDELASSSSLSNAELAPKLRAMSCGGTADKLLTGPAN